MTVAEHGHTKREEEEDSDVPPPPDGGWGWMVVFGSFMIHIITDGVTYSFGVFYNEFLDYFRAGNAATTWIHSILVGVTLCSGPLSSSLVNRWGCRAVTIAGTILASACLLLSKWAQNVTILYLTIGLGTGIGFGLIYLPAIVSVTMYFEKKRSLATGIAVCGAGIGTFVFAPIITKLLEEYGWRGSVMILSGIVLQCILFGSLFRPLENDESLRRKSVISNSSKKIMLKAVDSNVDIHTSEHNLTSLGLPQQRTKMHRPHSVAHFTLSRMFKSDHGSHTQNSSNKSSEIGRLALSQPMLSQSDPHTRYQYFGSQSFRKHGPIDKPDVFYQGSLMNIPSYRSRLDIAGETANMNKRHSSFSYKRRPTIEGDVEPTTICGFVPCSQETKDTLREMLDFSLFKDVIFVIFTFSNLLTSIGFNVPFLYIASRAIKNGLTSDEASLLISIIGIANTIGRIVLGYISDVTWINRLLIYNWCLTICGIATIFSAFCTTFVTMAIYASVFGFTIGAYVGLTSVILVDLLGLEKLTNAFGLLLLFQGVASLVGPPMAGALTDWSKSYDPGFYLAGIAITLSGVVLFAIPPIQRWQQKKLKQKEVSDI